MEFDVNPSEYVVSNWTLIQWFDDKDPTVLYLKSVKKTNDSLRFGDKLSSIGGFIVVL